MATQHTINDNNVTAILKQAGYVQPEKITKTLQGQIWRARSMKNNNQSSVIKVASKELHKRSSVILNGKQYKVEENIVKETKIIKYLSSFTDCPQSIIRFHDFFKTKSNYFLVMENGGNGIFEFIQKAHKLIQLNKIDISEWRQFVKIVFKQIIEGIEFMHSKDVCHFDISLENMTLVNDVQIYVECPGSAKEKIRFVLNEDINVKLVDFGLADIFTSTPQQQTSCCDKDKFQSTKFCGKRNYQCPEIVKKEAFNAKANDIWCAGVCLFMMISGGGPWHIAHESDSAFKFIMNGQIKGLLKSWNRLSYFDDDLLDLICKIFQPENQRISIQDIKQHKWFNN